MSGEFTSFCCNFYPVNKKEDIKQRHPRQNNVRNLSYKIFTQIEYFIIKKLKPAEFGKL